MVPAVVPPGQPVLARVSVDDRGQGGSPVYGGEAFLDAPGQGGTGFEMRPGDGALDSPYEALETLVPTTGLADGTYAVLMHGVDAAGLWGPYCTSSFEVRTSADTTGPAVAGILLTPNPTRGAAVAVIRATASDADTGYGGVTTVEVFLDPAVPPGEGMPMQADDGAFGETDEAVTGVLDVSGWAPGAYLVGVRARDDRGLWGASERVSLQVSDGSGDPGGPTVARLTVSPDPVDGAAAVTLRGWIRQPLLRGSRIGRAEYFLESSEAPPGPRMVGTGAPIQVLPGHVAPRFNVQVDVSGLPAALHTRGKIFVRAMDVHGNWGPLSAIAFWMTSDPSTGSGNRAR